MIGEQFGLGFEVAQDLYINQDGLVTMVKDGVGHFAGLLDLDEIMPQRLIEGNGSEQDYVDWAVVIVCKCEDAGIDCGCEELMV